MIRIGVIGHKEVPSYNGGIEAVLTETIPLYNKEEVELVIYNRWTTFYKLSEWKQKKEYGGFKIVRIPTFKNSFLNAFVYSLLASIHAMFCRYDIVHYHAEGPSAMSFLPKLTGKKIVCTNHGLDWNRGKWGGFASKYLKFGEKISATKSDALIVLSDTIAKYFKDTYNRDTIIIRNGININDRVIGDDLLNELGLRSNEYYLAVGRMVPEKGFHYLITAYSQLNTDKKLVLAGELTESDYCKELKELAKGRSDDIVFAGFIGGELKKVLFSNAYTYVIPSELEGMSISLLEALSYGCKVVASDIAENKNIYDVGIDFFKSGESESLLEVLDKVMPLSEDDRDNQIQFIRDNYNWSHIVDEITGVYKEVIHGSIKRNKAKIST